MSGIEIPKLNEREGIYEFQFRMAKIDGNFPALYRCIRVDLNDTDCTAKDSSWKAIEVPENVVAIFENESPIILKNNDRILQISAGLKRATAIDNMPGTYDLANALNMQNCPEKDSCLIITFPAF